MSFYGGLARTATRLIIDKGQILTLKRNVGAVYDPALGKVAGGTPQTYTILGAVFDVPEKQINDTSILRGDKHVTTTADAASIVRVGDTVTIQGKAHTVVSVQRLAPGGIDVIAKLLVRAGA